MKRPATRGTQHEAIPRHRSTWNLARFAPPTRSPVPGASDEPSGNSPGQRQPSPDVRRQCRCRIIHPCWSKRCVRSPACMVRLGALLRYFAVTITDATLTATRQAGPDRRRGRAGRVLRAAHLRPGQPAGPPAWSAPIRTSDTSSGTSATSRPTTWTCGLCSAGWKSVPRAHVLICKLACYLTWHLRRPERRSPSPAGSRPAGKPRRPGPPLPRLSPLTSTPGPGIPTAASAACWEQLATLTRNQVRFTGTRVTSAMVTEPTTQRQAFSLLRIPIPLTLT